MEDRYDPGTYHSQHAHTHQLGEAVYNQGFRYHAPAANINQQLLSETQEEEDEEVVVHPHDVLAGRGVNIAQHPGNQRFRTLISTYKDQAYCSSYTAQEKRAVAQEVMNHITSLDPPGRFLKREGRGHISRGLSGPWEILSEKECIKKTCQALRDCNRLDRTGYAEGVNRPDDVKEVAKVVAGSGKSVKERAKEAATSLKSSPSSDVGTMAAETSSTSSDSVYKRRREDASNSRDSHLTSMHPHFPTSYQLPHHPGMPQSHMYFNTSPTHSQHSGHPPQHYHIPPQHAPQHAHAHYHVHYHPTGYPNFDRQMAPMERRHPSSYGYSTGTYQHHMLANNSNNHIGAHADHSPYNGFSSSDFIPRESYPTMKRQRTMDSSEPSTASSSSTQVIEPPSSSYQTQLFHPFPTVPEGEETDVSFFQAKEESGEGTWSAIQPDPPSMLEQDFDEYGLDNID